MTIPQVTILTAVRNGAHHIASTIDCALQQTYRDWEYLIVDDASTDATAEIVQEFERRDGRIRLIRRLSSGGPYIAANEGLRQARGTYVVRTDADDHFPPQRIARQIEFLKSHPEYRACISFWQAFTENGIRPHVVTAPRNSRVFRWELVLKAPSLHSAVCYERSVMEELGGYPELPLAQDYWLWCQLTRRNWLGTIPEVLCYVRYHEGRQTHVNSRLQVKLGLDVLHDHMLALTGERWPQPDLAALRALGLGQSIPVEAGRKLLDRWDRLWNGANDLTLEDRADLSRTSALIRWKHLRANARSKPVTVAIGLCKLLTTRAHSLVPALLESR